MEFGPELVSYKQEHAMEAAIIKQAILKKLGGNGEGQGQQGLNDDVLRVISSFAFYPQDQYKQKQYKNHLVKKIKKCCNKISGIRKGFYEGHWGWQLSSISTYNWEEEEGEREGEREEIHDIRTVYEEIVQLQSINCMTCGNFVSLNRLDFLPYDHENKHTYCDCEHTYEIINVLYWRQ
jgi:RNA polymerase-binding transcription factor DksA